MSSNMMHIEKFNGKSPFKDFIRSLECMFVVNDIVDEAKRRAMLLFYLTPDVVEIIELMDEKDVATYNGLKTALNDKYNGRIQAKRALDEVKFYKIDYNKFEESLRKLLVLIKNGFNQVYGKELLEIQISWLMQKLNGSIYDRLYNNSDRYQNGEELVDDLVYAYRFSNKRSNVGEIGKRGYDNRNHRSMKNFNNSYDMGRANLDRTRRCYVCNGQDHLARECKMNQVKKFEQSKNINKVNLDEQNNLTGPSYKIEITVNDKKIKTHCDSGTPISLMTKKFADKLELNIEKVESDSMAITGVAKGKLNVEGIVYVELKMDDSKFKTPIVVISGETTIANDEILLGTNFTSQFVCTYTDKGVYFGNKLYPNLEEINLKSNHIQENQKDPNELYPSSTVNVDLDTEEDRIFANFENVVSKDDLDVGTILMDIPKKVLNNKQYRKPPRFRYSPLQESLIVSYVRRLLENNIVIMKDTPFVTNFILVQSKNKSNEIRFAVDLRALNEITQPDMYITKTPNELMNYLSEAELFSTLDIRKAFWSMKIPDEDVHYYGVFTPIGTICFLRMPFGDINAMPNFQRIYDKIILQSVPRNSVAYVDDLLIFSKDNKEVHLKLINSALQSFEKYGIKINKAKSKIMLKSISFLGWEISNGMKKPGNQIDAIKNRKDPSNPKEMKSLLGALNFFRDTVEGYFTIVRPLQDMANNNKRNFQWNEECEKARKIVFEKLETKLLIPRFDQKFYLYTDASLYAISGAILQKVEGSYYPVKFYSKKLKYQKRQKSINMLEMQAIAYTLVANMELLYLSEIQIFTDNKSVITILRDSVDPDYTKYIAMISSFNFTISYINTKVNSLADFLSRQEMIDVLITTEEENLMKQGSSQVNFAKSDNVNFNVNVINKNIDLMPTDDMNNSTNEKCRNRLDNTISLENRLKAVQSVDLELQSEIKENPTTYIKLNNIWHKKILLTEEKKEILVPAVPRQLREKAIQLIHDANGHMGFKKTWKLMRMMMFWPTCKKDLKNHIKSCLICQKYSDVKPELPKLKVSQLPDEPFKVIAVDVGVVPNYGLILQTICSLTKFWVPQIIKDQTVETIITTLNKNIFLKYGRPEMIICDSYPSFISEQFREFLKENNINLHVNTPYAKTKNSIVERSFRTMWDLIGKIREQMDDNRLDFETIVMTAAYYYNTHYQLTSDETPFYLVFNREERPYLINKNSAAIFDKYPSMADTIASTRMGWKLAAEKSNLNRSIDNERKNVKENRIVRQFSIGDKVLVRNYIKGKLDENYSGPYIIIKKNDNEYQLRKENSTRGRLIVRNIKDLKQFINQQTEIIEEEPVETPEKEKEASKETLYQDRTES